MSNEPPTNPFAAPTSIDEPMAAAASPLGIDTTGLPQTRNGLKCAYIAICGLILTTFAIIGCSAAGLIVGVAAGGFAILGFAVLYLVGVGMCIAAPRASRSSGLAAASLVLLFVPFGVNFLTPLLTENLTALVAVSVLGNVAGLASYACFLIGMRRIANYIGRTDVAARATRTLITGFICLGSLVLFGGVIAFTAGGQGNDPGALAPVIGVLGFIGGIGSLIAFLMYANTITYLRKAISELLAGGDGQRAEGLPPV